VCGEGAGGVDDLGKPDDNVKSSISALRCMLYPFNVQKVRLVDKELARLELETFYVVISQYQALVIFKRAVINFISNNILKIFLIYQIDNNA